jgi:predicted dehydrogenase
MGGTHARALHGLDGVEVAAIFAQSTTRGEPLAHELKATFTRSVDDILADPAIDAIDICLPTPQHREMAERAIAAGKHVLLEKPITMTMEDADALVDLADRTDRVFMIAHVLRFWPEYAELQRLSASGDYGQPISAVAYRRQAFPAWSALFSQADLTGGAVIDMMIHDFDALNWVLGTPVAVTARGVLNPRSGGYDQVQVMIEYADGRSALVDGGMMMPDSYPFTSSMQLLCERGAVEYHFHAGGRSVEMGQGLNVLTLYPAEGDPKVVEPKQVDPYEAELAYFVDCIRKGTPATRAAPADARLALAVSLAARRALDLPSLSPILI